MKPTKQLILGLREAANRLRNESEIYVWNHASQCNCGILAQCLLNKTAFELRKESDVYGVWSDAEESMLCFTTRFPMREVIEALYAAGLEVGDLRKIEYGPDTQRHKQPLAVADYFDELANELEERRHPTSKEPLPFKP